MNKDYNKDTFCAAAWQGMHLSTMSHVIPCCLYKQNTPNVFGTTKKGIKLTDHYNSNEAKSLRRKLWNGEKPEECGECWLREKEAKDKNLPDTSYRQSLNRRLSPWLDDLIENTNEDFSLKKVNLKFLDLRWDNKCNLKCRICSPEFSSALYKEFKNLKFAFNDSGSPYNISVDETEYEVILEQLHNVKFLFFAGGEPLTQDRFYEILQYCIDNNLAKDITLWITSNITKVKYKKFDLVKMMKHFKEIEITASIDGSHERGEYLRDGSTWSEVIENIKYIKTVGEKLRFMIVPTPNIMNAYNIVDLYKEFLEEGYIQHNDIHVNFLTDPAHLQLKNLPEHHKKAVRQRYLDTIEWIKNSKYNKRSPYELKSDIRQFEFLITTLDQERSEEEFQRFLVKTKQVDQYRGNDFYKVFPEFADFIS